MCITSFYGTNGYENTPEYYVYTWIDCLVDNILVQIDIPKKWSRLFEKY